MRQRFLFARIGLSVVGIGMVLTTGARVQVWRGGDLTLWQEAVRHSPEKPRPWINLGAAWQAEGQLERAAAAFQTAAWWADDPSRRSETAMRARDVARLNLALLFVQQGRYEEALAMTLTIQPRPDGRSSLMNRLEAQWQDERARGGPPVGF